MDNENKNEVELNTPEIEESKENGTTAGDLIEKLKASIFGGSKSTEEAADEEQEQSEENENGDELETVADSIFETKKEKKTSVTDSVKKLIASLMSDKKEDDEEEEDLEEDEEEDEDDEPRSKKKPNAPKVKPKAKPEPEDEEEDDDIGVAELPDEDELLQMSAKELYALCKERDIDAKPKKTVDYYVGLLEEWRGDNSEPDEEEDNWDDEDEDEGAPDYSEMSTKELYQLCKERKIDVMPKKPAKYYIAQLEEYDRAQGDWGDDEDDYDDDQEWEDEE